MDTSPKCSGGHVTGCFFFLRDWHTRTYFFLIRPIQNRVLKLFKTHFTGTLLVGSQRRCLVVEAPLAESSFGEDRESTPWVRTSNSGIGKLTPFSAGRTSLEVPQFTAKCFPNTMWFEISIPRREFRLINLPLWKDIMGLQGFDVYKLQLGHLTYSDMCKLAGMGGCQKHSIVLSLAFMICQLHWAAEFWTLVSRSSRAVCLLSEINNLIFRVWFNLWWNDFIGLGILDRDEITCH